MYIIFVNYKVPFAEVEKHLETHRAFLREQYAKGNLLASGPRRPRTGGIIIAKELAKEEIAAIIAQDPFKINQVADYEVMEFDPVLTCKELDFLRK